MATSAAAMEADTTRLLDDEGTHDPDPGGSLEAGAASSQGKDAGKGAGKGAGKAGYKSTTGLNLRSKFGLVPKEEHDKGYKSVTGLGIRGALGIQPKSKEEKRREQANRNQKNSAQDAKRLRQQEAREKRELEKALRVEGMLPWSFETQLAFFLGCIKIPIVLLVAVIGIYSEHHLKSQMKQSWLRKGSWGVSTSCYAHKLADKVEHNTIFGFNGEDFLNRTLFFGKLPEQVFKSNITIDPVRDVLGGPDTCNVDMDTCTMRGLEHPSYWEGGIDHFVPLAFIWLIYKLVFIGIHPIDRLVLKLAGDPPPGPDYPEPLVKLITEPYFQTCTTAMRIVVKILCYFRYKLAANALLGALASMRDMSPKCPRIVYYKMDPFYGTACYFMCIFDLLSIGACYFAAHRFMEGKLIGRWRYRLWKVVWMLSSLLVTNYAISAAILTFGGITAVLRAIGSAFRIVIRLSLKIRISLDVLRVMAFIIIFLESLELAFLIVSILFPQFFKRFGGEEIDDSEEAFVADDDEEGEITGANRTENRAENRAENRTGAQE